MSYFKSFIATFPANGTNVTCYIGANHYEKVWARMPTFSTATDLAVWVSHDGDNYYRPTYERANTSTSSYNPVLIGTSSSGYLVPLPIGFPYYKFVATATVCATTDITVLCKLKP